MLPPDVPQFFAPVRSNPPAGATLLYRPSVFGAAEVFFKDGKSGASESRALSRLAPLAPGALTADWSAAAETALTADDLEREPATPAASFDAPSPPAAKAKSYTTWSKALVEQLSRTETLELLHSPSLDLWSDAGEPERDFRLRLRQAATEARDARLDALRARFAPKRAALEEKIRRAEQAVQREAEQARNHGFGSFVRVGTTILDAVLGRRKLSATTINKAGAAIRGVGETMKQTGDVTRAKETVEALKQQNAELDEQFQAESAAVERATDPHSEPLDTVTIAAKKANISPRLVALVWSPFWRLPDGSTVAAGEE
jgi:hypothetical protein